MVFSSSRHCDSCWEVSYRRGFWRPTAGRWTRVAASTSTMGRRRAAVIASPSRVCAVPRTRSASSSAGGIPVDGRGPARRAGGASRARLGLADSSFMTVPLLVFRVRGFGESFDRGQYAGPTGRRARPWPGWPGRARPDLVRTSRPSLRRVTSPPAPARSGLGVTAWRVNGTRPACQLALSSPLLPSPQRLADVRVPALILAPPTPLTRSAQPNASPRSSLPLRSTSRTRPGTSEPGRRGQRRSSPECQPPPGRQAALQLEAEEVANSGWLVGKIYRDLHHINAAPKPRLLITET